ICGVDSASDDGINSTSWSDCARLLNYFYPDWQVETLDPVRIQSSPSLASLEKDGIYNRAGLIIPKKWKFTGGLYKELLKLANEVPVDHLDSSALVHFFPHEAARAKLDSGTAPISAVDVPAIVGAQVLTLNHEQMTASR